MITAMEVLRDVAAKYGIDPKKLRDGGCSQRWLVWPRQELMWRLRQLKFTDNGGRLSYGYGLSKSRMSFVWIGRYLNCDHTTVIHGVRAYMARQMRTEQYEALADALDVLWAERRAA